MKEYGRLIHWSGGHWTLPGAKKHPKRNEPDGWRTDTNTIMALFRKGLVQIEAVLIETKMDFPERQRKAVELMNSRGGKFIRWPNVRWPNGKLIRWQEGRWAVLEAKVREYTPGYPEPDAEESVPSGIIWSLHDCGAVQIEAVWKEE